MPAAGQLAIDQTEKAGHELDHSASVLLRLCQHCFARCAAVCCRYCGYEVTTEGDSFTIAFHDAFDAVCWSLAMQQAMLEAGVCADSS